MEKAYAIWRAFQDRFLARVSALMLLGCTLLALLEVVRRYVFGVSFEWQQDAVTLFVLAAIFLHFGTSQRRGSHLNVTLLPGLLETRGDRARRAVDYIRAIALAISLFFMIAVVWWGIPEIVDSMHYASRSESLAFPLWPFLLALLAGFAFMAVSLFFQVYRAIQKLRGRIVLADPVDEGEALH